VKYFVHVTSQVFILSLLFLSVYFHIDHILKVKHPGSTPPG
jgi:hypothetical protein